MIPVLPILGEPLIPEFANTLYIERGVRVDVLNHPAWTTAWLEQAPCAVNLTRPRRLSNTDAERLRLLRNAVRGLLAPKSGSDRSAAIAVVNHAAGLKTSSRSLTWQNDCGLVVVTASAAPAIDALLSAIGTGVIDAVESGDLGLIEVCARPDCNMFYFRHHHRRRYCNQRCASADRQARYNLRR
jgi:Putative stress-induced transcription regulator